MPNYYYLGTLLPDLNIGEPPEIGFKELDYLLKENLSAGDYVKTNTIRSIYDIANLRPYWKGKPLDPYGNLDAAGLEEALATRSMLPEYVFEFIDKYSTNEERLRNFAELSSLFFRKSMKNASGLFQYYLKLEREIRLMLAAFRAKKLGRDIIAELQYEDPRDSLVAQIIAQKDAKTYDPPEEYESLKAIFDQHADNPIELQQALLEYRFQKIADRVGVEVFSIDRILAYMIELIMVEKWLQMDKEKGLEIVDTILKEPS